MKMNLSWYKGDDIIHQQLVRPRRKQMLRKPKQWVTMKAQLERTSQNKRQDRLDWKMLHLHMAEPYQNLSHLIIQMQKLVLPLLALLPQQLLFSSLVGTQLLGQNKYTVLCWVWRRSFWLVQICSGDIDVTSVPSEQLIQVTAGGTEQYWWSYDRIQ